MALVIKISVLMSVGILICLTNGTFAQKELNARNVECGGTINGDSGTLLYPEPGEPLKPGELCVWTIHLETKRDFKMNISYLDIPSAEPECGSSGLRIYSLTNFVKAGDMQSYTFCNSQPGFETFYLGEKIAVIVLRTSETNQNPGYGFDLSWTGNAYDPTRNKHLSSLTTASSGIIRYPVVGHYEPNLAATWLIQSATLQDLTKTDLQLNSISLDSCGNPEDRCTCDALIFYEISPSGILTESRRFCGEDAEGFLENLETTLILAFYTDSETQSGGGVGFEVIYYPASSVGPTTTTTIRPNTTTTTVPSTTTTTAPTITTTTNAPLPTTTVCPTTADETIDENKIDSSTLVRLSRQPREGMIVLNCGENMFLGYAGYPHSTIFYKSNVHYENNERCVWTIRIPDRMHLVFYVYEITSEKDENDGLVITTFGRTAGTATSLLSQKIVKLENTRPFHMAGSVAVVTFHSDSAKTSLGFQLNFYLEDDPSTIDNNSPSSKDIISTSYNTIRHPILGNYANRELSQFVFTYTNWIRPPGSTLVVDYTYDMDICCYCCDSLHIYLFSPGSGWGALSYACSAGKDLVQHDDMVLFIFKTDDSLVGPGITLNATLLTK